MNYDSLIEIYYVVRNNRLRTGLTAFSVAWGILFLVLFLGFANGLQNGALEEFQRDAVNSIWVNAGKTSAVFINVALSEATESDGYCAASRAAAPATCGADIDVPLRNA